MIPSWNKTRATLEDGIQRGLHHGAQIAISLEGRLSTWAVGSASPGHPMSPDSLNLWMSAAKPLTATALARLVDAGRLHWDDPVVHWIPEFAGGGKHDLTLRHLLTHTGGFRPADKADPRLDWTGSVAFACATELEPGWIPGESAGYHANGSWFVLGEILQRASGLTFTHALHTHVISPLGLGEGWFGIPPSGQARLAHRIPLVERSGRAGFSPDPVLNDPVVVGRCRPGSGLRAPATFLCRFYQALLSPPDGWLQPGTLRELVSRQRQGRHDRTFMAPIDFGLGFILNTPQPDSRPMPYGYGAFAGPDTFGHSGNQASCAFADPRSGLAVAWVCNGMPGEPLHQARQHSLNSAIYLDLADPPG